LNKTFILFNIPLWASNIPVVRILYYQTTGRIFNIVVNSFIKVKPTANCNIYLLLVMWIFCKI